MNIKRVILTYVLIDIYEKVRKRNHISGTTLTENAKKFATADVLKFTPSVSQLQRWKLRHGIIWKKHQG